jgi:hypothetical protein
MVSAQELPFNTLSPVTRLFRRNGVQLRVSSGWRENDYNRSSGTVRL